MILYEDTALVVVDKPAGLSSEDGVPAALRKLWGRPDAYVGVIHRLDTGVSGLMVYAKTPQAAAALSRQVTQSQQVYAEQDGRAEPDAGTPDAPPFVKQYRALIRQRAAAYDELAKAETLDFNRLYEADTRLHETWFSAMGKMYLWRTLQNAHADYSRFRMLDTLTTGGLAEVVADHHNLIDAIERCDLAAFEPLVERHLYGGIRRLGSKLTEEYADYFE